MEPDATGFGGLSPLAARAISIAGFFVLWWLASVAMGPRLCPNPLSVVIFLGKETVSGELPYHLAITLARVAAAFVIAMAIGTAIGLFMGRSTMGNLLLEPWIILLLNAPALVIIVLAYIWIGLVDSAAITAVALNKIPNVAVTIREGARVMNPDYFQMARVFRFSRARTLRHVSFPQLQPYIAAAARSGLALIWKIVLVVELLGRPNGVGFQIYLYFQTFDVRAILAYTIAFAAIMLVIEYLLVQPIEKHVYRWRPKPV